MLSQQPHINNDRYRQYYSAKRGSTETRAHSKSIHAIAPSKINSSTTYRFQQSRNNYSGIGYLSGTTTARDYSNYNRPYGIKQNLFTDDRQLLKSLQREQRELQQQSRIVAQANQQEYQIVVSQLMETRRLCNRRRQDLQMLKEQLSNIQFKPSSNIQKRGSVSYLDYDQVGLYNQKAALNNHRRHSLLQGQIIKNRLFN